METKNGQIIKNNILIHPETIDNQVIIEDKKNMFKSPKKTLNNILIELMNSSDNAKVDKIVGKQLSDENYSLEEKSKLSKIENEANKYIHPATHEATIINQDDSHRFVTKQQVDIWNSMSSTEDMQLLLEDVKKENLENIKLAIKNIIANSPNNLDTLEKIAKAINLDPNYDTTIKKYIKEKLNTVSNSTTVAIYDLTDLSKVNDIDVLKPGDLINLVSYTYEFFELKNKEGKSFNEVFTKLNQQLNIENCYEIEDKNFYESSLKDNESAKLGDKFYISYPTILKTYLCINTDKDITDFNKKFRIINENDYIDKRINAIIDSAPESLDTLKEISKALNNDADFAGTITKQFTTKVDKVNGKQLSDENYSLEEKNKLSKIENEANKYIHPNNHSADIIIDNANKRFTNDTEKDKWNNATTDVDSLKKVIYDNNLKHFTSNNIFNKLEACKNGFVDNLIIKGKTLENLVLKGNIEKNVKISYETLAKYDYIHSLKQNTKYTVIFNSNKTTNKTVIVNLNGGTAGAEIYLNNITKGLNKCVINTGTYELNGLWIYFQKESGAIESEFFNVSNVMILENEINEIPLYFEGVKSVGENDDNKIKIRTYNENIFNGILPINIKANQAGNSEIIDINVKSPTGITIVAIDSNGKILNNNKVALRFWESNTSESNYDCFLDKNYLKYVKRFSKIQIFWNNLNTSDITISRIIIGLGDCAKEIMNYGQNYNDSTSIQLSEPLYGIENEISDVLNYSKEERIKNIGKKIFNGADNENWNELNNNSTNTIYIQSILPGMKVNSNKICDKFTNYSGDYLWKNDVEGIADNGNGMLHLRINKSRLPSPDINGAKAWMKENPFTLFYPLTIPIKENIKIRDTLQTFQNGYLELLNSINPFIELDYAINVISVISRNVKEIDNLVDKVNKPFTWNDLKGL